MKTFQIQDGRRHKMADYIFFFNPLDIGIKWKGLTSRMQYTMKKFQIQDGRRHRMAEYSFFQSPQYGYQMKGLGK